MQLAGNYEVGELVGRGGLADVHVATEQATGERVAVKRLRRPDPGAAQRLAREAEVLDALDHPAIPRLHHFEPDSEQPFLVLELVEGTPLARLLDGGPIGVDRACTIGACVADALAYAHARGVVHRDIKPANLIVRDDDHVHVIDFGVARHPDPTATLTGTGLVVGTVAYLAPEQVRGETVGPAADVYALGLVLLECVTGDRVYDGSSLDAALARLHEPPAVPPDLPDEFAALVGRMTALDPGARPSAIDVASALRGEAVSDDAPTIIERLDPPTAIMEAPVVAAAPAPVVPADIPRPAWLPATLARAPMLLVGVVVLVLVLLGMAAAAFVEARGDGGGPTMVPTDEEPVATFESTITTAPTTTAAPVPPPEPTGDESTKERGKGHGKRGDDD